MHKLSKNLKITNLCYNISKKIKDTSTSTIGLYFLIFYTFKNIFLYVRDQISIDGASLNFS